MESRSSKQDLSSPANLLALAAASGMLAGFIEVILLGVQKFAFGKAILLGPRIIWMAAAANLSLFVLLGLLMLGLSRFLPQLRSSRFVLTVFGFLSLLGWLLIFPRIKWYASLILAAGLAVQSGQLLLARTKPSTVRLTAKLAAIVLILLAVSCEGWLGWHERKTIDGLPAPPANAPNVLLIVLDTVGARNMSLYGYQRATTPNLEVFARRGAVFENAISTAPWTAPSHAGMFTGRYPYECSADWDKPLDNRFPTLAETLQGFGYATGGVIANTLICGYESGLNRGFIHYDDYTPSASELLISSSLLRAAIHSAPLRRLTGYQEIVTRKSANEINHEFLGWLDKLHEIEDQKERPFFAFLNYLDAHEPYLPPAPFDSKFGQSISTHYRARHDLRRSFRYDREKMTAQENLVEQAAYDGAIAYLDEQIGLLLNELERRKLLDNTLVIITADHGENFGEHGYYTHGDNLYLQSLRVPLLMIYPQHISENKRIAGMITLRDLPATILELAGFGYQSQIPGCSLAQRLSFGLTDGNSNPSPILSEVNVAPIRPGKYPTDTKAEMRSVFLQGYHFIRNANGREELYDFLNDPVEQKDILNNAEHNELIEEFRSRLERVN